MSAPPPSTTTTIAQDLWPGGHRAALLTVLHIPAAADAASGIDRSFLTGSDYLATGLQRLLTAFADLDISATTAWTSAGLETSPQLVRATADHGHEIAISTTGQHRAGIAELAATASRLSGTDVTGMVELLEPSGNSAELTAEATDRYSDFRWSLSRHGGDVPVLSGPAADSALVTIPTSPYWNDATWLNPLSPQPPSSFLETISTGLQSIRTLNGLMTLVIHPHISGRPGFAETIVRFLDEAIGSGDVWMPRAAELAEWWVRRQTDPSEAK